MKTTQSYLTLSSTPVVSIFEKGTPNASPLLTWENMFENTKETIKERKNEISPSGKSTIHKDPIEFSCPLNQPSPFQFNNRLRYGFRQYLNGDKSA